MYSYAGGSLRYPNSFVAGEGGQQNTLTLICPYVERSQWRGTNPICRRRRLVTLYAALRDRRGRRAMYVQRLYVYSMYTEHEKTLS